MFHAAEICEWTITGCGQMMMMIGVLQPLLCAWYAKWAGCGQMTFNQTSTEYI